jgi:hypothetical protein
MSKETDNVEPILKCPHCHVYILIEKLNCGIFRHAILKKNGMQVNPHAPKNECDFYISNQLVYGCCKPFKIIQNAGKFEIEICDYI